MGGLKFRDAYEFDPETYGGGGGLLGRLEAMMQQGQAQPGAASGSLPNGGPEYNPGYYGNQQGGLLGRLLALQAEQSRYRPVLEDGGQPSSLPSGPSDISQPMSGSAAPYAESMALSPAIRQNEADQSRQAREAAAARLVRGVKSGVRAEAPPPDPVDIARSAGIGFINGGVNAAGLPADALAGFGYLPNNQVTNWATQYGSDAIRRGLEERYGEFYKPKTSVGRFAETIGEMTPMVLAGGLPALFRTAPARAALGELFGTLAKHAVAPGVAVQTLEEALPDSGAGEALQKGYPVARKVVPALLAAKRYYLSRRTMPQ